MALHPHLGRSRIVSFIFYSMCLCVVVVCLNASPFGLIFNGKRFSSVLSIL